MKAHVAFLFGTISTLLLQCNSKPAEESEQERTPIVLCFDVEDYTSPEEVGMDDIPKWLAEIMTEEGVTGSFFVIGEKARMMEERGRQDVIAAMARHDIGSHTNFGSIHPTVTEILEEAGWEKGVERMIENESAGIDELERIYGQRPANLARHGGSYGPQLVAALGRMNAGYIYSPVSLPGHNAVWFCNALNFHGEGDFGFFDDAYYRDDLFDPMLTALDSLIPAATENIDVVAFFGCHPSKVRSIQFWDFNYYYGANPGPEAWQTPELRPLESMETAKKNFRRLVRYLRDRDDIELTTFRELTDRFSYQRDSIGQDELKRIAKRIIDEKKVVIDEYYSPAEIFAVFSQALAYPGSGLNNHAFRIQRPYGPMEMPLIDPEISRVSSEEVLRLAGEARRTINETGHLPAHLMVEGNRIGTGSLLALFSAYYLRSGEGNLSETMEIISMDPYPSDHEEQIIREVAACKTWPVHREDLDMTQIIELTRLQLWTLKPAWETGNEI